MRSTTVYKLWNAGRSIPVLIFTLFLLGCVEEQKVQNGAGGDENSNPGMVELNPYAWKEVPMEVIIADFQESDGIFSSFICDEIDRRLSADLPGTLQALSTIDRKSRINAFTICFHPEAEGPIVGIEAIRQYAREYPELVNEIKAATEPENIGQ